MNTLATLKHSARTGAFSALHAVGFLERLVSRRLRGKATVLMYHRVIAPSEARSAHSHPGIVVSPETFDLQMRCLRAHFRPLGLDQFIVHLANRTPFEDRSCLVTFDDGWVDNHRHAFPVLKQHRIPAVIFLSTAFIGSHERFWQERLRTALERIPTSALPRLDAALQPFPGLRQSLEPASASGQPIDEKKIDRLTALLKSLPHERIGSLLTKLESLVPAEARGETPRDFLNWEEVGEMAASGIEFGSHGVNHHILTANPDQAGEEIAASKTAIENRLGKTVLAFSYPNGDHNEPIARLVRGCGYRAAFTTTAGAVSGSDDPFRLKRYNVHESISRTTPLFLARATGLV